MSAGRTGVAVGEICRFSGIRIWMWPNDEHHAPHFHAEYAGVETVVDLGTMAATDRGMHPRARRRILRWARAQRAALYENWDRIRLGLPVHRLSPPR